MRKPFMAAFIAVFIAHIVILEILIRISDQGNGLLFEDGRTSRSLISFASYVPIIISVILGLFWAEIDHDVKRLEPFFQLSKPGGSSAEDSLLLDYPYRFSLVVPFVAFRKRQWTVLFSSLGCLAFLGFATPLMGACISRRTVERDLQSRTTLGRFREMGEQEDMLSVQFAYVAHEVVWLNRTLSTPPFANTERAILPFAVSGLSGAGMNHNETWVGKTESYEAELQCTPAVTMWTAGRLKLSSQDGLCSFMVGQPDFRRGSDEKYNDNYVFNFSHPFNTFFIGHQQTLGFDEWRLESDPYSLSSDRANCARKKNVFLGLWDASQHRLNKPGEDFSVPGKNFTAVFCKPRYWKQRVIATLNMPTGTIVSIDPLGKREKMNMLNATFFEQILGSGIRNPPIPADIDPDGQRNRFGVNGHGFPLAGYQLRRRFGRTNEGAARVHLLNSRSLSTFALAQERNLNALLSPSKLAESFNRAYKLLFAFAVATDLVTFEGGMPVTVERRFTSERALKVNMLWCRLLQATFALLTLLSIGLCLSQHRRVSCLDGEPVSLANMMMFITNSPGFMEDMKNTEHMDSKQMRKILTEKKHRYQLTLDPETGPKLERIEDEWVITGRRTSSQNRNIPRPVRGGKPTAPIAWELSKWMGFTVFLMFLGLLVALTWLYIYDRHHDGKPK
jgi:hypothetical protein